MIIIIIGVKSQCPRVKYFILLRSIYLISKCFVVETSLLIKPPWEAIEDRSLSPVSSKYVLLELEIGRPWMISWRTGSERGGEGIEAVLVQRSPCVGLRHSLLSLASHSQNVSNTLCHVIRIRVIMYLGRLAITNTPLSY